MEGCNNESLRGIVVIEMAGLAPAPYCGMILSDFGATVIRVDRVVDGVIQGQPFDTLTRGKQSIAIDLKKSEGRLLLADLISKADVVIDCYRPGTMERLGVGPQEMMKRNGKLIYARLTGYGQSGTYSSMAGHDINYIALSGALSTFGRSSEPPLFPMNVLGDFAAGGMLCALGIVISLYERLNNKGKNGGGKLIDSAMIDGTSYLSSFIYNMKQSGLMSGVRGTNMLDSGAHYYEVYKTKDDKYISVGAIEPQFYAALLKGLGLDTRSDLPEQNDSSQWPMMKDLFKSIFITKTRDEWESIFINTDACIAPVLEMDELSTHQHCKDRNIVNNQNNTINPAPKLFNQNNNNNKQINNNNNNNNLIAGQHTISILKQFNYSQSTIEGLLNSKVIGQLPQSKL